MGLELPADIGEAAQVFNSLATSGLDPATASSQELFDALFKLDGMEVDIFFKTHGQIPGAGNVDLGGGFSSGGGGSIQELASSGGGLFEFSEGGRLGPGWNLIGERGKELAWGNFIFDSQTTSKLLASGLVSGSIKKHAITLDPGTYGGGGSTSVPATNLPTLDPGNVTGDTTTHAVGTTSTTEALAVTQATQEAVKSVEQSVAPALAAMAVALPTAQDISSGIVEAQRAQINQQMRQTSELINVNKQMLEVLSEQGTSGDVGRAVRDAVQSVV